ncbi:MAG: TonB-dependent receptor plug domain-containing protein [Bacteroidia bacterium]|nr:TonB-dependent receptor plug domain-containing protein [Bacteroidia bacterium]
MKKSILLWLSAWFIAISLAAQTYPSASNSKSGTLVLIDGKVCNTELNSIDPKLVESVTVLKGQEAMNIYGESGRNGVILVTTNQPNSDRKLDSEILVIVNGKVCSTGLNLIDPKRIESVSVLKDQAALKIYGEAGKKGVILVTLTNEKQNSESEALVIVNGEVWYTGFNSIDPKRVESLAVLKDQAAFNLYGEAGKNGVILVTTK